MILQKDTAKSYFDRPSTTIRPPDGGGIASLDILSTFPHDKRFSHNYYAKPETDVVAAATDTELRL